MSASVLALLLSQGLDEATAFRLVEPIVGWFDRMGGGLAEAILPTLCAEIRGEVEPQPDEQPVILSPGAVAPWWDAYGLQLLNIGEEGEYWLALGHHEPRRMVAAIRKAAREQLHLDDEEALGWDCHSTLDELLAGVRSTWAVFREDAEHGWYASWADDDKAHPSAVPVTVLAVW